MYCYSSAYKRVIKHRYACLVNIDMLVLSSTLYLFTPVVGVTIIVI